MCLRGKERRPELENSHENKKSQISFWRLSGESIKVTSFVLIICTSIHPFSREHKLVVDPFCFDKWEELRWNHDGVVWGAREGGRLWNLEQVLQPLLVNLTLGWAVHVIMDRQSNNLPPLGKLLSPTWALQLLVNILKHQLGQTCKKNA